MLSDSLEFLRGFSKELRDPKFAISEMYLEALRADVTPFMRSYLSMATEEEQREIQHHWGVLQDLLDRFTQKGELPLIGYCLEMFFDLGVIVPKRVRI